MAENDADARQCCTLLVIDSGEDCSRMARSGLGLLLRTSRHAEGEGEIESESEAS
jgi:hypothetical protein